MLEVHPDPPPDPRLVVPLDAVRVLPDDNESVPGLLRHNLPAPLMTLYRSTTSPWSCSSPPSITPLILVTHLIPPKMTVDKLLSEVPGLPPSVQSIRCTAILPDGILPNHLPIWILSFWQQVYKARQWRHRWNNCQKWTTSKLPTCGANLLNRLNQTLINVRWQGYLNGRRHDRCIEDVFAFLSNGELDSGQINDLLELIENESAKNPDPATSAHVVAPTELALLLASTYENQNATGYQKRPLQVSIEDSLVSRQKSSVASVSWISLSGCGHWISYVVNPVSSSISYGDSLGKPIPGTLSATLQWWLLDIRKKMNLTFDGPVTIGPLAITPQDDSFSCGILATNSIGHHLLRDKFPLVGRDSASIKAYRVERTIEILMLDAEFVRAE